LSRTSARPQVPSRLNTYGEFSQLGKDWTGKALVDMYNNLAAGRGKEPVRRFMTRDAGLKRLWGLIQELPVQPDLTPVPAAPNITERVTKKETVLRLVQEP
jgi:hypothetical protein